MKTVLIAILALALAACSAAPTRPYDNYLTAQTGLAQSRAMAISAIADASDCKGASNQELCVAVAKFTAAMALQGGDSASKIAPPPREVSGAEKFAMVVNAITPGLGVLANAAVAIHQSDNSRDIAIQQQQTLGNIASAPWSSLDGILTAVAPDSPGISVGGDYITGQQHVGDSVGGDQHVGDWREGNDIGGDDNSGNSGRINSPGPYDDNSGQCDGTNCQGGGDFNPPPVEPDGDG